MAVATFKASSKWVEGFKVDTKVRDFSIRIDEPAELGGSDTGMNPVEAQLAALGSCLTIVTAAFAEKHNIDLQEFWIEIEGDLDPDGFLKGKPGIRNGFQEVRVFPHIKSNSSEEDVRKYMKFVMSRCPVSDNMENNTPIIPSDPIFV
ncbi:MAG: OsmC family protein [Chloroflexota bacterium]|nr:OsmC family protein [Chloroflexota bacterium]